MSGGSPITLYEIAAHLVKDYGLTMEQIGQLDRWTIRSIYFYPRDEHGALKLRSGGQRPKTSRQQCFEFFEGLGMPAWWIERKWRKYQEAQAARKGRGRPRSKGHR